MNRWLALAACLLLPAAVPAADAAGATPDGVSGTVLAESAPPKVSGFEVGVRLSALGVYNGSPLAYRPFELGWRFSNGLRIRTGIELFYYEDKVPTDPAELAADAADGKHYYSYEMQNIRSSIDYVVPMPYRIRPVVGLSFDALNGSRSEKDVANSPKSDAWSVLAAGVLLGMDARVSEHATVDLQGRFSHGFTETGAIVGADLGWHYLF